MKFNCPSCGAPSQFNSNLSLFFTCPYCRTQVFKNENQIESMGQVADLPEDMSPLQLFSEGTYGGKSFKVLGRVKLKWDDGYWNEWYLGHSNGTTAWLAEAQGEWIYSVQINDIKVPAFREKDVGSSYSYNGAQFTFADFKQAKSFGFEGELPFKAVLGESRESIDLLGNRNPKFLSFETDDSGARAYLGTYVSLKELKINNLRKFHGWES